MENATDLTTRLPPGTRVGPWRLLERQGQGSYGTVYRAVRAGHESAAPVALKLARFPEDARFEREVELLSRLNHPAVPRFEDSGQWQHPSGAVFPYLAMEWVEGLALYDWVRQHAPTSRQVLRLLAQLASALEATHSAGGVHRDVKGSNILVRLKDSQVFLIDFGVGRYQGAATLTDKALPPGTPTYRSPEACRFSLEAPKGARYPHTPADDLFALGVTAYRLVTGDYPPSTDLSDEESKHWQPGGSGPRPPQALNARCCFELSVLILRMLSLQPKDRGTAGQLVDSLKTVSRHAGSEADVPLCIREPPEAPAPARASPRTESPQLSRLQSGLLGAAASACVFLVGLGLHRYEPSEELTTHHRPWPTYEEMRDGGSSGVADASVETPMEDMPQPPTWEPVAREIPPKPFPGQIVPDAKGRCYTKSQVSINGGCWVPIKTDMRDCKADGYFEYQGECYLPIFPPARPPALSAPTDGPRP